MTDCLYKGTFLGSDPSHFKPISFWWRGQEYTVKKNKRYILLIIALITAFTFAFGAKPVYAAAFSTDIRVLLSVDGTKPVELTMTGGYYLEEDPSFEFSSGKVTVSLVGNRPVVKSGDKTFTSSSITFINRDYSGTSSYIKLKNSRYGMCTYLGNMRFDAGRNKQNKKIIRVINTLPIERYLYGVVPYEMSNTYPIEALKAQAVCARGYAVVNCSVNRRRVYDILDTSADQVYHGYASKYTRAIKAVDETAGQVLTYKSDIIQAYYSASNGGQTEPTTNGWTADLPYYVQADDIYDLKNADSLEDKSFIPSEFNSRTIPLMDGIVLDMLQQGANNAAGKDVKLVSTVRVKARDAIYDPPSRSYTKADVTVIVDPADGSGSGQLTVTIDLGDLIYSEKNLEGVFNKRFNLRMRGAETGVFETKDGKEYDGWFLTNRRYGHGKGMSQRSAQQRATDGQSFTDILAFYYVNTQLCTIGTFESAPALKSRTYSISGAFICDIKPGTTPSELLSAISPEKGESSIISAKGNEKKSDKISTGDFVRTIYGDGTSYYDLPVVLYGDTDGDGEIAQGDIDALRQHLLNTQELTGVYLEAADVNHDGNADSLDVLQLLKYINGDSSIDQQGGKKE